MMTNELDSSAQPAFPIPLDDLKRTLVLAGADQQSALHLGLAGDIYAILPTGKDTAGRFCLIDMHIPPGGGPPPHRHDFEESFIMLAGEMEVTFRGRKSAARAGTTTHIPQSIGQRYLNMLEAKQGVLG